MIRDIKDEVHSIGRVSDCTENLDSFQGVVLTFISSLISVKLRSNMIP